MVSPEARVMVTLGVVVYPKPILLTLIELIPPKKLETFAVAFVPPPPVIASCP